MERLREKAAAFGIKLSDHQLEQFETYYEMLVEKNKVMNLTAITEKNEVIDKHFADSLALIKSGVSLTGQKILERDILYDRINRRVDIMAEQGLIDEVKRLKEEGYEKTMVSMQGIGYRQVFEYLEGNLSLEDTIEQIKKDTRHFAKRQLTWFGREKEVCMVDKSQFGSEDEILTYMLTILKEKGIYDGSVKELL